MIKFMKKLSKALISIFTIIIPVYLVVYLPDQVDWFEDETKSMSNAQKISYYSKIISEDPEDEDAYYDRGQTYFLLRKYDLAINDLTKVIELDPENDWAYYYRGESWWSGHLDKEKAIKDIKMAIKLNPDNEIAKSYLRIVFKEK